MFQEHIRHLLHTLFHQLPTYLCEKKHCPQFTGRVVAGTVECGIQAKGWNCTTAFRVSGTSEAVCAVTLQPPDGPGALPARSVVWPVFQWRKVIVRLTLEQCMDADHPPHPTAIENPHITWVPPNLTPLFFFLAAGWHSGILVPRPGIEPVPPAVEEWSPNTGLPGNSLAPTLNS